MPGSGDQQVADAIVKGVEAEGLLGAEGREALAERIASGTISAEDWIALAERERKATSEEHRGA